MHDSIGQFDRRSRAGVRHQHRPEAPLRLVRRRMTRQAVKTSGSMVALTKLDILDGFDEIKSARITS